MLAIDPEPLSPTISTARTWRCKSGDSDWLPCTPYVSSASRVTSRMPVSAFRHLAGLSLRTSLNKTANHAFRCVEATVVRLGLQCRSNAHWQWYFGAFQSRAYLDREIGSAIRAPVRHPCVRLPRKCLCSRIAGNVAPATHEIQTDSLSAFRRKHVGLSGHKVMHFADRGLPAWPGAIPACGKRPCAPASACSKNSRFRWYAGQALYFLSRRLHLRGFLSGQTFSWCSSQILRS